VRRAIVALVILIATVPVMAQESASTIDTITRARQGPGFTFPLAYEILPASQVILLERSADSQWFLAETNAGMAWIPAGALENSPDDLPIAENLPPVPDSEVAQCVNVVGDSVPYGSVVYIVPGHGFGILRTTPFALVLEDAFAARGLWHLEVRDRSAEAAFLSEQGKNPYREIEAYDALLDDGCRLTVIMPWINDLSVEREGNASAHLDDLVNLIADIRRFSEGEIVVLGFYHGQPSDFAREHAPGYIPQNIDAFNEAIFAACEPDGPLADVTCMETDPLFAEMHNAHVLLGATQQEVEDLLYEPIPSDVAPFFEVFWRDNPDGEVIGDGVHLSDMGKRILAQRLVDEFLSIDPDL
jgi:hypothetical protein